MVGKADATPGYRGMHSFTLNLENYFVPAANLVGGEDGLGRGFYLQMGGFAAGRLQTGAAPAGSPRPHSRRRRATWWTGCSSARPSPTTASRATRSG